MPGPRDNALELELTALRCELDEALMALAHAEACAEDMNRDLNRQANCDWADGPRCGKCLECQRQRIVLLEKALDNADMRALSPVVEDPPTPQSTPFERELESLVNRFSKENGSDTPDFILAEYLTDSLKVFDKAVKRRTRWYQPPDVCVEAPPPRDEPRKAPQPHESHDWAKLGPFGSAICNRCGLENGALAAFGLCQPKGPDHG